jgi:chromosome segregation ATPase
MVKESNANLSESGSAVKDNGENIITQEAAQQKLEEATQKLQDNNDQQTAAEAERKPIADRLESNRPKLQETEQKLGIAEKKRNTLSTAIQNNSKRITEI